VKLAQFSQPRDAKTQNAGLQRDPALLSVVAGTRNNLYRTQIYLPYSR